MFHLQAVFKMLKDLQTVFYSIVILHVTTASEGVTLFVIVVTFLSCSFSSVQFLLIWVTRLIGAESDCASKTRPQLNARPCMCVCVCGVPSGRPASGRLGYRWPDLTTDHSSQSTSLGHCETCCSDGRPHDAALRRDIHIPRSNCLRLLQQKPRHHETGASFISSLPGGPKKYS